MVTMDLKGRVGSVFLLLLSTSAPAAAQIEVSLKQMAQAVEVANTPFKRCMAQSDLFENGTVVLTKDQLDAAETSGAGAETLLSTRYNGGQMLNLVGDGGGGNLFGGLGKSLERTVNQVAASTVNTMTGQAAGQNALETAGEGVANPLMLTLGSGYAASSQTWLTPFNSGDAQMASALLAHEAPTDFMRKRKNRKDPNRISDDDVANKAGALGLVERGFVSLAAEDLECSVNFFDVGLRKSDEEMDSFWGNDLERYEHIMAVNMKAIGYLLAGDERAGSMANASRDLQGVARDKYYEEIAEYQAEVNEKADAEVGEIPPALSSVMPSLGNIGTLISTFETVMGQSALAGNASIASRMTSPYVNPLPDYLSAVIAETEAMSEITTNPGDEWNRASVAWRNAASLAPQTQFLNAASDESNRWSNSQPPPGQKLVHVLVGVGSTPTDTISRTMLQIDGNIFPVVMPVKVPNTGQWAGGTVQVQGRFANLEPISDIEGMVMRQSEDKRGADMTMALVRGLAAFKANQMVNADNGNFLNQLAGSALTNMITAQSTESWSSLPETFYAARLLVPISQQSVLVSVPGAGAKTFPVLNGGSTFIYATAKPDVLTGIAQSAPFGGGELDFRPK